MNSLDHRPLWSLVISWILLLPLLFFVARGTFSFDRASHNNRLEYSAGTLMAGDYDGGYFRVQQVVIYGLVCAVMFPLLLSAIRTLKQNLVIILLPFWSVCSILWSQDRSQTLVASVSMCVLTLFSVFLAERFSPERQVELFLFLGKTVLLISILLVYLYPSAGIAQFDSMGAWQGMFEHKNHCAIAMTYLLLPAFCMRKKGVARQISLSIYVVGVLILIAMTQSRTGWILAVTAVMFIVLFKLSRLIAVREKLLLALVVTVCVSALVIFIVNDFPQLALLLGRSTTLTGRADIWKAILPVLWKKPLLGFGYKAFWLGLHGDSANLEIASGYVGLANAENAVLQIFLELGAIGVLLMFFMLLKSCKDGIWCFLRNPSLYVLWYCSTIFMTILALVDGDKIMFPHSIQWVLYVIAFVGLTREKRRLQLQNSYEVKVDHSAAPC
jgi:exopolysaccharide production protein ExoQ